MFLRQLKKLGAMLKQNVIVFLNIFTSNKDTKTYIQLYTIDIQDV